MKLILPHRIFSILFVSLAVMSAHFVCGADSVSDFTTGEGTNGWVFLDSGVYTNDTNVGRKLSDGDAVVSPVTSVEVSNFTIRVKGFGLRFDSTIPYIAISVGKDADSCEREIAIVAITTNAVQNYYAVTSLQPTGSVFCFSFRNSDAGNISLRSIIAMTAVSEENDPSDVILLSRGSYTQDFESFSTLESSGGDWINREGPLHGWQAYMGTADVCRISRNAGTTQYAGLYALSRSSSPEVPVGHAIGSYASENKDMIYGLVVSNDTLRPQTSFAVSFTAEQWGAKNKISRTLVFQYLMTNGCSDINVEGDWQTVPELCFMTPRIMEGGGVFHSERKSCVINPIVAPGSVLMMRWLNMDDVGYDAVTGVDDFSLSWTPRIPGISLHVY